MLDKTDAAMLAELARAGFYRAVRVKSEAAQGIRALLKARDLVLRQRMDLDNASRSSTSRKLSVNRKYSQTACWIMPGGNRWRAQEIADIGPAYAGDGVATILP
jgi:hypothetical protein